MALRSTTIDLQVADSLYQPVLNSIRRYRAGCRELYATLALAQTAGATITEVNDALRVTPANDAAAAVLAASLRGNVTKEALPKGEGNRYLVAGGKTLGYDMREWFRADLYPGSMSFVWDSARQDVTTVWKGKDQEFPTTTRGWLVLQGARNLAQFNWRGIGCPAATARPVLDKHTLMLKWDHALNSVAFQLPRLDSGRYYIWKALRDKVEGWKLGTLYLNEKEGKLKATLSYECPDRQLDVEPDREARLVFGHNDETFFHVTSPDSDRFDAFGATSAAALMQRFLARRVELERRRASCGNPKRPWGHKKGWLANQDVLSRSTRQRENAITDYNHAWTRRIVSRCGSWRCGKLVVQPRPEDLLGQSWPWAQFDTFLRYKCEEAGVALVLE